MTTFDRSQVKAYIGQVEDDAARFVGAEFQVARIIGYLSAQHELGALDDKQAGQLLADAYHLGTLVKLGHRYVKLARNPSAEMRILVLADEQRERRAV